MRQRPRSPFTRSFVSRLTVMLGLAALVASPLLPVAPAEAAGCAPGWTPVGDSECELIVTSTGEVTIPADVGTVDVMVVGGGGGGGGGTLYLEDALCDDSQGANSSCPSNFSWAGGGGGGGQEVCKGMELSGTVSVTVGEGGFGAESATYPAVTPPGEDGGATTVGTCTTPGGKGGGSSVSIGGVRQNGAGGDSGNGNAGWDLFVGVFAEIGGGGGGAGNPSDGVNGGRPSSPQSGCFAGTTASWASGGGGGAYAYGGGLSFFTDLSTGEQSVYTSGSNQGFFLFRSQAVAGPPNSGNGGGGGQQIPRYRYSSGEFYDAEGMDGADGGSGVVIMRYSLAGEPTVLGATGFNSGSNYEVTVTGTGFACEPEVTIGGTPCTSLTVLSSTEMTCTVPAGSGLADVVVTTAAGSVTAAGAFCFGVPGSPECATDNGGGGGDGGGGDTGGGGNGGGSGGTDVGATPAELVSTGAQRSVLPETGASVLLAATGAVSVALGASLMALGRRRRID